MGIEKNHWGQAKGAKQGQNGGGKAGCERVSMRAPGRIVAHLLEIRVTHRCSPWHRAKQIPLLPRGRAPTRVSLEEGDIASATCIQPRSGGGREAAVTVFSCLAPSCPVGPAVDEARSRRPPRGADASVKPTAAPCGRVARGQGEGKAVAGGCSSVRRAPFTACACTTS